ncbi:MAG: YicC family protein [Deltaproteobacteria bacterium]|nr:MAG: YicC family protein [Deltaproteobacteria bacterium]
MSVRSMTGFGRGEIESDGRTWVAEIRCVNNRYLDMKIRLPREYASLEEKIRSRLAAAYVRGRVELHLGVSGNSAGVRRVTINSGLAAEYLSAMQSLGQQLDLPADVSLRDFLALPDVLKQEQVEEDLSQVWPVVERVVDQAIASCLDMQVQEGRVLEEDLLSRLASFTATVERIERQLPLLLEERQNGLTERLKKLLDNVQLDPARLAQEVALLADKTDVTEEIVRLHSHLGQFHGFLEEQGGVGRKLDFLIQEILREVNTLGSKINDASIAHHTVELKSELEKIREQVQNIE